jgi:hypothetical protein
MLRVCGLPLAAALAFAPCAQAQSKEDAQKMLVGLYLISIAVDACDLDITKEQEQRLDKWTEWAEEKVDVADRKLDKAYAEMEEAVEKDKDKFCKEMKPVAEKALKDLP